MKRLGARRVHVAPQAVDPAFWSAPAEEPQRRAEFQAAFVGAADNALLIAVAFLTAACAAVLWLPKHARQPR